MSIRLLDSDLWNRDWFLELKGEHQFFVFYIRDHCNHAGIWQPNKKMFSIVTGFDIDLEEFLKCVNSNKTRVLVLDNGLWWMSGFIEDQYRTKSLCYAIAPHKGAIRLLNNNNVPYEKYGYSIVMQNKQ